MIRFCAATPTERHIGARVERAVFSHLGQKNFFVVDVVVVSPEEIEDFNKRTRGVDRVTDVLSYPQFEALQLPADKQSFEDCDFDGRRVLLGNIMICRQRAKEQAQELGHSYEREFGFLICHGLLHILGFDHIQAEDEEVMLAHQRAIMQKVGLKR